MLARRSSLGQRMQEEEQCSVLPFKLLDTAETSQDGSSLELIAPTTGGQCYI